MPLPTPTALTATVPYTDFSTRQICWMPTTANQAAPTLAEVNAGKNLTLQITAVAGFTLSAASIDIPRAGTNFTGSVPGRQTADASSLTFILSQAGPTVDVRSVFSLNQVGYIIFFNEGIVTGGYMDVWPVRVASVPVDQDLETFGQSMVQFSIPSAPSQYVAIPLA